MPFCSQCGVPVQPSDLYCAKCGGAQPRTARVPSDPLGGLSPRTAGILCYIPVIGWVAAIMVLAAEKFRENRAVRFHAFQGLYLFVAWLIVNHVIGPMFRGLYGYRVFHVERILETVLMITWIFMIVKASQEQTYSLPVIGELAERSVAEN